MLALFKAAAYTSSDVSAIITQLENLWVGSSGGSGGDPGGGETETTYNITNNLTNVTNSNSATSVDAGGSYSATLTVADGNVLNSVVITMGGVDVTSAVYSKAKDGNKKLSDHFKVKEFACHDGTDTVFVSDALVQVLEQIRRHFGKPVNINSGYRTEAHNKANGGAAYSQHKYGMAADISIQGVTPGQIAAYAETLLTGTGGSGIYKSFCHVDVRKAKSRWKG